MYLTNVEVGQKARVVNVEGQGLAKKLYEFGILNGASVQLMAKHPMRGPLVVKVGKSEVAVGRRMAGKIQVELDK